MFIKFNHSKAKGQKVTNDLDLDIYSDPEDYFGISDDKKQKDELILSDSDKDQS